jgi:hypothetical protein
VKSDEAVKVGEEFWNISAPSKAKKEASVVEEPTVEVQQGGLGEEGESSDLVGTTTPSGPSPLRGSGAPSEGYDEVSEGSITPVVQDGKVKKNFEEEIQMEDGEWWKGTVEKRTSKHKEDGGYINYISHHGVEKDTYTTTPLRMVANSATNNCNTGPAVNDLWPKGPNSLSNLLRMILRWRCYPLALVWNLSKAYHSIHTSEKEKFLRLIW